jgi:hypothetical protein
MALSIGTNISYRGKNFLDQRQGQALTLSNLLSWSEPVPDGFEVYCEGKWYVYKEDYFDTITGHFKLRIDNEVEDSQIQSEVDTNTNDIQHLRDTVYPIEFRYVSGGGVYKVGSQIIPEISWEIWKDDVKIKADSIEVMVNGVDDSRGVMSSKERYVATRRIPNETTLIYITATYRGQRKTIEVPILYNLIPKKYIVLSNSHNPIQSILELGDEVFEDWAGATEVEDLNIPAFNTKINLDCTGHEIDGGIFIHYLIPQRYFPGDENFQTLIGGLEMSDLDTTEVPGFNTNYPEGFTDYVDLCLNNKQNGLLDIEFKEVVYQKLS